MKKRYLYQLCPYCDASGNRKVDSVNEGGQHTEVTSTCDNCGGTKELLTGFVKFNATEFVEPPFYYSYQIFNCLNATECGQLAAAIVPWLNILMSQGVIDMTEGHLAKTVLWEWFGAGSVTRANLITLIG